MPLRVLGHPWHTPHAYELLKLPVEWSYLPGDWHHAFRPFPTERVRWVDWGVPLAAFDVVVTHVSPQAGGAVYFERLKRLATSAGVPLVAIQHGTPEDEEQARGGRELVGETMIVCNSHESQALWAYPRSQTIIHGFTPEEWPATTYAHAEAVVSLPPIPATTPFFGSFYNIALMEEVRRRVPVTWIRRDVSFGRWEDYRAWLGQRSIIVNPTRRSPMPRARGEAMMMGLVPVTTNHMGEDRFIEHGVNGYLVPDEAEAIAETVMRLLRDRDLCGRVGRAARQTAMERFSWGRWAGEWMTLLDQIRG